MALLPRPVSVARQMWCVVGAMVPGVVLLALDAGPRLLLHVLAAWFTAVAAEAGVLLLRRLPLRPPVTDGSVVVLAMLLGIGAAPFASPLVTICATLVAVLVGKHVYGGLGNNLFNPAMVGYAFMLVCFPLEATLWRVPVDGVSGATLLEFSRSEFALGYLREEFLSGWRYVGRGLIADSGGPALNPWPVLAFAAGGLYLMSVGIVRWRIPVSLLAAFTLTAMVYFAVDPSRQLPPITHVFSGSVVLAAFFVATDPVTSPVTPRGQLLFGAGVGILIYLLRVHGAFADGVAFAVLMMNASAAWLDGVAQPYSRRIS